MSDRFTAILEAAARCFDDHRSPFELEWLVEQEIEFDDCGRLAETIATAIRYYIKLSPFRKLLASLPADMWDSELLATLEAMAIRTEALRRAHGDATPIEESRNCLEQIRSQMSFAKQNKLTG